MKKVFAVMVSPVLALSLALTGCGGGASSNGGGSSSGNIASVLHINNQDEPGTMHPGKAEAMTETWPIEHLFEGLMTKTPDGKIVPGMAKEDPKVSADGKTYTFTLRDGLKWSNGDPLTAHDFEFAWKYALAPSTASQYAYQLYSVVGGEAYNTSNEKDPAKLKKLEDAVGVKATDDKTLVVHLVSPMPYFLDQLTQATFYPIDEKVQKANPKWADDASSYVSNGPYKLIEWKHKQDMKMVKNDNYYDKNKIKTQELDWTMISDENTAYQMFRSGQIDLGFTLPTDVTAKLKQSKDPSLTIAPNIGTYYYDINVNKKPFDNVKVRQALALAIDRKAITEKVSQGGEVPAYGFVPLGIPDANGKDFAKNTGDLFQENVAQAKQLLAEGLKEEGMTSVPPFTILYNTLNRHKKIAEAIQEMWRNNLGINCTLENVEMKVKIDRGHKHDFTVMRDGWNGDYVDPMTFMDTQTSVSPQNYAGWKNKDYDALINKAKATGNQEERMKYMHEAEKLLVSQMPVIPIYYYTNPYAVGPNVKGVFCVSNRYPDVMYAYKTQ
ncbi:peptide ABC transporter substrate-binding protein [Aneurinibacillus terranovensis]|uniref:peptide ABC transporter substrate-binding protein n=1 Tax=Aneurinibacillus terranovensis TaxID=278991 RepID=UPI000414F603|nr:peptide ABC transporter substrate-binding protein [Aneurinibacillus terranovensis]